MPKSENKLARAKGWFLSYCETMNKLARSRGDDMSPKAWAELRSCRYAKLCEKIHNDKDYKCGQEEIDMILEFYDKLADLYARRKDKNMSKEDYVEQFCVYRLTKLMEQYPAVKPVVPEEPVAERKEEDNFMSKFLGKVSIADKIARIKALDFEHPSKIDWESLFKDNVLFFNSDNFPVLVTDVLFDGDDCLLSYDEWHQAFELEKELMRSWTEYVLIHNVFIPLQKLKIKRAQLFDKFTNSLDEQERSNLRFEIEELDKEISSCVKVA